MSRGAEKREDESTSVNEEEIEDKNVESWVEIGVEIDPNERVNPESPITNTSHSYTHEQVHLNTQEECQKIADPESTTSTMCGFMLAWVYGNICAWIGL